jgi:hypothetical protein
MPRAGSCGENSDGREEQQQQQQQQQKRTPPALSDSAVSAGHRDCPLLALIQGEFPLADRYSQSESVVFTGTNNTR